MFGLINFPTDNVFQKKEACLKSSNKKIKGKLFPYLRLFRTKAAATAMIAMTATPIAMYVVVGSELDGGVTACVGDGETGVWIGVGLTGVTGG